MHYITQRPPGFSNPNKKVHGIFHSYIADICKTDQNQLEKTSVIRFPKEKSSKNGFAILKLVGQWYFSAKFIEVNFGNLMTDGFFN